MMIIHKNQGFDDDQRVMKNPTSVFSGAPKVNDHTTSGYSSMKLNEAYSTTDYHGPHSHPSNHH